MKIIITGVAGFIGSSFAATALRNPNTRVIGIDNLSRRGALENLRYVEDLSPEFMFHKGDIRDRAFVDEIVGENADATGVVHLAGQTAVTTSVTDPRHDFEANALGTFNVLEAVRKRAPRATVLYSSTNKVYGGIEHEPVKRSGDQYAYSNRPNGIDESCPLDFHSPYGCSKGAGDQYVRDYARIYGLKTVVFRQSCIYGPRQFGFEEQGWVAWFTIASILRSPITVFGDGYQTRDLLWVDDLCDLYLRALEQPDAVAGEVFNIGGGAPTARSVREVIADIAVAIGRPITPMFGDWRPGDQRVFVADVSKIRRTLGWSPQTRPTEGIAQIVAWAEANRHQLEKVTGALV